MQEKKKKILIILSIIILLIGIIFLGVYINKNSFKKEQVNNKTYYEVTLKPNNFFLNNKIKAHNYYIASSIKTIDIYFNYYLKNSKKNNINYSYDITATLKSYANNGTKLIFTKDFNLKNINNINKPEINIKENYSLDYDYYVNYVKSFQEYYNIKTETYLDVKLNIKINTKIKSSISLTIPISENVIEITMKEDNTFLENNANINLNEIILFIFIIIVSIILVSKNLFKQNNEEALLKEYQDIIITIQNKPNINSENIIYLTNLKDLINIATNNNINIFNYLNNYYLIINPNYYVYTLKKIKA